MSRTQSSGNLPRPRQARGHTMKPAAAAGVPAAATPSLFTRHAPLTPLRSFVSRRSLAGVSALGHAHRSEGSALAGVFAASRRPATRTAAPVTVRNDGGALRAVTRSPTRCTGRCTVVCLPGVHSVTQGGMFGRRGAAMNEGPLWQRTPTRGGATMARAGVDPLIPLGYDFLTFLAATVLVVPLFKRANVSPVLGYLFVGVILNQLG